MYAGSTNGCLWVAMAVWAVVDPISGAATQSTELPDDFFVRDLELDENRLFIAGFSGIYVFENTILKTLYLEKQLPALLINAISVSGNSNLLINNRSRYVARQQRCSRIVLGTQNRTIIDFGRQGNSCGFSTKTEF